MNRELYFWGKVPELSRYTQNFIHINTLLGNQIREEGKQLIVTIKLYNPLPRGFLLPTLSIPDNRFQSYQFQIVSQNIHICTLAPIGMENPEYFQTYQDTQSSSPFQENIDYFSIDSTVSSSTLKLHITFKEKVEKNHVSFFISLDYTTSLRHIKPQAGHSFFLKQMIFQSQKKAAPAIKNRICSPTSVFMRLTRSMTPGLSWNRVIDFCKHPHINMYGIWPQAVFAANRFDHHGFLFYCQSFKEFLAHLHSGFPLIASIRFKGGYLKGSPLFKTAGHLVLITGIDRDKVIVYDPALDNPRLAPIEYDVEEFFQVWKNQNYLYYSII